MSRELASLAAAEVCAWPASGMCVACVPGCGPPPWARKKESTLAYISPRPGEQRTPESALFLSVWEYCYFLLESSPECYSCQPQG